jgi:N6-L-threonylcarbamoyladenine synthase
MIQTMIILGIETSCDETAAALVNGEGEILSSCVLSQLKSHEIYGGVVPEIAAREHMTHLTPMIGQVMGEAGFHYKDLSGVAATCGPGLIGGVMIGMMAGKAIAAAHGKPFLAVNHLEGHALTPRLSDDLDFPYLLLLVSGGHSQLLAVEGVGAYKLLGTTIDDAAGECFDKSGKMMGLPFPGGPAIEKIAAECPDIAAARAQFPLPRPLIAKGGTPENKCDFSFSGIKTAVRTHLQNLPGETLARADIADLAASLQITMAEVMANRCKNAMEKFKTLYPDAKPAFVVSGGVAANKAIRAALQTLSTKQGFSFHAPPLELCGDNAVMIAWAGVEKLTLGQSDPLNFKARPRWPLDPDGKARHSA